MTDPAEEMTPADYVKELTAAMAQPIQTVLTLRDHFALAALSSILRDPSGWDAESPAEFASLAYCFADAMLKARERTST